MTETVAYEQQQTMIGGGEVMEVMMTGGDGSAMNEDTLAQVVNMLQTEGQLTGANHTIIIRQPGSDEIQMIQTTSNGGELVVTKASAEEIQALQTANVGQEILEAQQGGQVVMMDESGNLVEGMVQMQDSEAHPNNDAPSVHLNENGEMQVMENSTLTNATKSSKASQQNEILDGFASMAGVNGQNLLPSELHSTDPTPVSKPQAPITITTNTNSKKPLMSPPSNKVFSIKINTGVEKRREIKKHISEPENVIKISTVTGRQKAQPPKFHKCESCTINFVSKVAYLNHMENCPSKKKNLSQTPAKGNITYTCVFCETKFNSRLILMQHVRTCDKAKATKSQSTPKPKALTTESKLKLGKGSPIKKTKNLPGKRGKNDIKKVSTSSLFDQDEDEEEVDRDLGSDYEDDEKGIVYDDEDDLNEMDFMDDDEPDETADDRNSQKHLGPIMVQGMYKCRDCTRTFSKEHQYNRHIKACTNAPLNASRIVNDLGESLDPSSPHKRDDSMLGIKRKRGRPLKDAMDIPSPKKKKMNIPKIVSIDPKSMTSISSQKGKKFSEGDSDDDIDFRSRKGQSSLSKIVKISPSDSLIKKTGKAILSKLNQQKGKGARENAFCGLCGDKFKTINDLALHIQASHNEKILNAIDLLDGKGSLSSVNCPLCDFNFISSQMLLFHMVSSHHRELRNVTEELETLNLNLLCPFCSSTCPSQELFEEHLAINHLEKFTTKPAPQSVPISIDVNAIIKEKNNGSIVPTAKLLSKQEKVLCPDCGLFLLKSFFEHHRCSAEFYSPSSRKFVCSEPQCGGMTFYKIIHLLTHLQQVHEKNMPCDTQTFDSMTEFIEWLKKEESKSKNKYTRALQRMKQGKLNSVWICHRFHNVQRDLQLDTKEEIRRVDRLKQCYSRIHAETQFNISTSKYDGKTTIKYFSEHRHLDNIITPKKVEPTPPKKPEIPKPAIKTAFTDAAELKQLLEDDGESSQNESVDSPAPQEDNSSKDVQSEEPSKETPEKEKDDKAENSQVEEDSTEESQDKKLVTEAEAPKDKVADNEEKKEKETQDVNFSDADLPEDLLLEKMLGEHDESESASKNKDDQASKMSPRSTPAASEKSQPEIEESKIADVDMLEAFGVTTEDSVEAAIAPEENSSTSTASNTQQSSTSSSSDADKESKDQKDTEGEGEGEENTYVLPADIEEWKKLFELVHSQVDSDSLSGEELVKAKQLLTYEDQITDIPIEKQVEVFNVLCSIANVQMT